MTTWKLKWFKKEGRKSEARDVYDTGNADLQAGFDVAWKYLRKMPRDKWVRPKAAKLSVDKGEFRDYFEIRFKANNTQQRPIGYFGPGTEDFTILIWVTEKGNKFIPASWRDTADDAREKVVSDGARYVETDETYDDEIQE